MRAWYWVVLAIVAAELAPVKAETTLVIEAAPAVDGPWQVVPIGPDALDLKGGVLWQGLPKELRFVRVRVVQPTVQAAHVQSEAKAVEPAVACACDACASADKTEESQ